MVLPILDRIRQWLDDRLRVSESGVGRWRRIALRMARLAVLVERRFRADLCLERAASLAFSSVIAFIPAAMIALLSLQLLQGANLIDPPALPSETASTVSPGTGSDFGADPGSDPAADPAADGGATDPADTPTPADPAASSPLAPLFDWVSGYVAEENRAEVREALDRLESELEVDRRLRELLSQSRSQRGPVTAIAIFVLILSAMTLFRSAERAFTGIWRVERRRSFFEKIATFWLLLTAAPLILAVSVYVRSVLGSTLEVGPEDGWLARFIQTAVLDGAFPLSISSLAFMLLMAYLPNTRVRMSAAAAGAVVAAIGWEFGNLAFHLYIQNTFLSGLLGALGVVPFFLLWVFFSWCLVLVGAETSYCLQHYPVLVAETWGRRTERTVPRPSLALLILERVYRAFADSGPPPNPDSLSTRFSVPMAEIEEVANTLLEANLIISREKGWSPARAAEQLRPAEVVGLFPTRAGFRLPTALDGVQTPLTELMGAVDAAINARLEECTFADLLADPALQNP